MEISVKTDAMVVSSGADHRRATRLALPKFQLHARGSSQRAAVERYIGERFASAYRARIEHFLPQLISLGTANTYYASVGLAPAVDGALFAETYLAQPVDRIISELAGEEVPRSEVLEIGNLVSTWKGSGLVLFVFLSELIERMGYRWVVFTATPQVQRLLAKLNYAPVVIADANPANLSDRGASWGEYYATAPRVMVGEVGPAVAAARKLMVYRAMVAVLGESVDNVGRALQSRSSLPFAPRASAVI